MIFILLLFYSQIFSQNSQLELFAVSDLVKIFEDGYNLPKKQNKASAFGIKGEIISAQFVIHSSVGIKNAKIKINDLINSKKDAVISSEVIQYNFIKSVPVKINSNLVKNKSMIRKAPALFPDYFSEEEEISIEKEKYQSVWLTINIPYDASPGEYTGIIEVATSIGNKSIPVILNVYLFEMPKESHLYTAIWYAMSNKYHDYNKKYDEKYWDLIEIYSNKSSGGF